MIFNGLLLFSIYHHEVVCNANIYVEDYVEVGAWEVLIGLDVCVSSHALTPTFTLVVITSNFQ